MRHRTRLALATLFAAFLAFAVAPAHADTAAVFGRYQDRVVQVRILEASSGAKAGVGSGFVASPSGLIVTNYHVVSDLVLKPGQYRGEVLAADGRVGGFRLVALDVVHDLAVLRSELAFANHFALHTGSVPIGERLYSLGTPLDLGFTIVEGTYNGLIADSLYEKIHFTGAINPGMSGGPTLLADGRVIGVNVATAGNQVGFLVPVRFVAELLAKSQKATPLDHDAAVRAIGTSLMANQERLMERLMKAAAANASLGEYDVPGRISPFLRCWGDAERAPENIFEQISQQCSMDDDIYLSRSQQTGTVQFRHDYLVGRGINRFRFYNLFEARFNAPYERIPASAEDVSRFACHTDFVAHRGLTFKAALCLRRYKRFPGLFDAVLRAATVDQNTRGVVTTLVMSGVSSDNARRFAQRYLESFAWRK